MSLVARVSEFLLPTTSHFLFGYNVYTTTQLCIIPYIAF